MKHPAMTKPDTFMVHVDKIEVRLPLRKVQHGDPNYKHLVAHIKENGLLDPIHVFREKSSWVLVDGLQRIGAFRDLGWKRIPATMYSSPVPNCNPQSEFVWTTKDGKKLRLSEIGDSHLCNIIRMNSDGRTSLPTNTEWLLLKEAQDRKLKWAPDHHCTFIVDEGQCGAHSTMWTAADKPYETCKTNFKQEPRCHQHRPDRIKYYKIKCDGCLKTNVPLIFGSERLMFCAECSEPSGSAWAFLWLLVFIVTLGVVKTRGSRDAEQTLRSALD